MHFQDTRKQFARDSERPAGTNRQMTSGRTIGSVPVALYFFLGSHFGLGHVRIKGNPPGPLARLPSWNEFRDATKRAKAVRWALKFLRSKLITLAICCNTSR